MMTSFRRNADDDFSDLDDAPRVDPTLKVLAWLGGAALGFASVINFLIAALALISGHLMGAVGDAATAVTKDGTADASDLASDAGHAALIAKLVALGFALLAGTEFAAAAFLKRRVRTWFVPFAAGLTVAGELAFSAWSRRFNALDAILIACALFATFAWSRLPRPTKIV